MNEQIVVIPVTSVVFRQDLYPRIKTSADTVQKYADDLAVLPPILINQHQELIDGWHRWTAHRQMEKDAINAIVIQTASDADLLERAIRTNATHGLQLSVSDKEEMARTIYHATAERDRAQKKKDLASMLSVSMDTIQRWLGRIDKDTKSKRNQKILEMWMACHTQEEIANVVETPQPTVAGILKDFIEKPQMRNSDKTSADHADEAFEIPIYNVWKQQSKTEGSAHFGNSDVRWVDNLLYLYTKPFDIVVDPFAGGGSAIDICKRRFRRYWVSDRKPVVKRETEIRKHDLTDGLPPLSRWKEVSLVYLDPPYWKQAEGKYSKDETDLANMSLENFHDHLAGTISGFLKKLSPGAVVALILQPTQWKAPDHEFTDHVAEMIRRVDAKIVNRIQAPYESQQCTAQMVDWAKENRQVLTLSREIVVWRR